VQQGGLLVKLQLLLGSGPRVGEVVVPEVGAVDEGGGAYRF
jgi:hypothetical protein